MSLAVARPGPWARQRAAESNVPLKGQSLTLRCKEGAFQDLIPLPSCPVTAAPDEGHSGFSWLFPATGRVGSRLANFLNSPFSGQLEESLAAGRLEWVWGLWASLLASSPHSTLALWRNVHYPRL